jgi:hypothetical protein
VLEDSNILMREGGFFYFTLCPRTSLHKDGNLEPIIENDGTIDCSSIASNMFSVEDTIH